MEQFIVTTFTKAELEEIIESTIRKILTEFQEDKSSKSDYLLDITEASVFLRLAKQTIYGLCSKSLLPHIKKGKRLYFSKIELEKWILSGKRKTKGEIEEEALEYIRNRRLRHRGK